MSLLYALPLLPLAVAAWMALSSRANELAVGWVVALVAAFPVAVAALVPPDRVELPGVLTQEGSALVLDDTARAALLLFGGLWLTVGLLLTRINTQGPTVFALLLGLSGATLLALAEGGPLVYTGMLATGYGLYAIMSNEPDDDWRRAGRALIVLLVLSDLLVFELLLSATADPGMGVQPGLLVMGLVAVILRGAIPPAHAWLPAALAAVGTPVAVLLVAVPTAAALFGALKLLPEGAPEIATLCVLVGLAGSGWAVVAGLAQVQARCTLGYAAAATAALLLLAFPAGAGPEGELAWLVLALLAACAALPLVALQLAGWIRDIALATLLLVHGLAAGHASGHAATELPFGAGFLTSLVAIAASLLLTLTARRTIAAARTGESAETTRLAFAPIVIAGSGLGLAWSAHPPGVASAWVAPVGITLGLLLFRLLPARTRPAIPPGDLLGPVERMIAFSLRWLSVVCVRDLPRARDSIQERARRLWDGENWSRRLHNLEIRLRAWPATSAFMLVVALGAAFLLAK